MTTVAYVRVFTLMITVAYVRAFTQLACSFVGLSCSTCASIYSSRIYVREFCASCLYLLPRTSHSHASNYSSLLQSSSMGCAAVLSVPYGFVSVVGRAENLYWVCGYYILTCLGY